MIRTQRGIPAFEQNAVLKLIIAQGTGFIAYHMIRVTMMVAEADPALFTKYFTINTALPQVNNFLPKLWTLLTYGWIHEGFWVLFSNMIWLYAFGSLVQMLVGHRQVIPIFIYSLFAGGIFYEIAQLIPGSYFAGRAAMFGAQAGVVGLAVAAITLAPGYRFFLGETIRIPIWVVLSIFLVLQLMNANINYEGAPMFVLLGGAAMGYGYVALLRGGYKPGDWVYNISDKINNRFETDDRTYVNRSNTRRNRTMSMYTPKPKQGITQSNIDDILDKINQKGYDALSKEDKETLIKASGSKDN
jgi:membrane associated rhomboid family serine protease